MPSRRGPLAVALGFVNVFDNPARQSFISEMVSAGDLPNAVTLNSVAMNMARIFGAALGGVIAAAIGLALCFACNALSFGAVLISLAAMRKSELFPAKRAARQKRQVRQGLRSDRRASRPGRPAEAEADHPPAISSVSPAG